ncbi:Outer membrane lipoprotein-sorting protein [Streptoalloteichus tenebrarius]|uniref:Outer membrane lipoprotein-sorting protein n=1 Tax=Streptoalloteichus tenebrarius (strain ATCC 17920 / DSM 40477 / JCM 4838 / CBS 697.72 / NBRC 16177 / NCIMB 11028 / NRRL B-12390 / A12253. 1 / ISP 5477) TaxID=1933 RepID=A0ABT1I4F2_STRSD|nr:sigma-E factor regulatory protein RseB domain-containing protein [Streptoalloteichus tenebrarius]MCP2262629.1 Outer membrane lipoprotein-sorting protein [Streptoalloteichus tenebrarius]BFF01105.1 sigma-E factor regulatory protein RseB domain-containing protein [Streptoalloteichus tenebrarius]
MKRRKATLTAAAAGTVAGVVGLGLLALPTSASSAPSLPPVGAEQLVESVLRAQPPAMGGAVKVDNALGLPAVPGVPEGTALLAGGQARVWLDGQGRGRVQIASSGGEQTIVHDGSTVWRWDSASRTVVRSSHPEPQGVPGTVDPSAMARELVGRIRSSSAVAVDGTARVANRDAYELVLTPAPSERTVLREVRVAVDAEKRVPLRVTVLANGSSDPVLQAGFTELTMGQQDAGLFRFEPPAGATVKDAERHVDGPSAKKAGKPTVVGDGWDTAVVVDLPKGEGGQDPLALVKQVGKPVEGAYGRGWLVSTRVGSALVTESGRAALGAVPEQVLAEALGGAR